MPNYTGGLAGAGSGAAIGTAFSPGVGTAIGGVLGGLMGLFSGGKDKTRKIGVQSPEQEAFLKNLFGQLGGGGGAGGNYAQAQNYISGLLSGSPESFDKFAAPYRTEFEQQTIPRLAERFAGLGGPLGGGALGSTGFAQALGGAGAQFQSNLAGLYAQLQQSAAERAFGQYNLLSALGLGTRAFEPAYQPGNLGFGGASAQALLQGIGSGAGMGIGSNISGKMFPQNVELAPGYTATGIK